MCDNDLLFSFRSSNAIVFQYHHHAKCPNLLCMWVCDVFWVIRLEKRRPLPQGSILVRKTVDTNLTLLPDKLLTSSFYWAKKQKLLTTILPLLQKHILELETWEIGPITLSNIFIFVLWEQKVRVKNNSIELLKNGLERKEIPLFFMGNSFPTMSEWDF